VANLYESFVHTGNRVRSTQRQTFLLVKAQSGVSLVESMTALVVISIGLLGVAALQITAIKQNYSALHHSQAVWIAYNISDRIRANASQFENYAGIDTGANDYEQDCMEGPCTTAELIVFDAEDLEQMVGNLPNGLGLITSPRADVLNIAVMWDDQGAGAKGTDCGPDPAVDLTCYSVLLVQ
jgi:type IV pilus assembly protein PilV